MSRKRRGGNNPEADLTRDLVARMEECPDAETLNARVLVPFMAALEDVCGARGYVLNIYGDTANLVFTGDPGDAEQVYRLVEAYLDAKGD